MAFSPARASLKNLNYVNITAITLFHLGAIAAPFFFSWTGLIVGVVLYYATGAMGITLGYHRLLTHHSYKTLRPVRYLLTFLGACALQGGPISWVATHRLHHQLSDEEEDPHTPLMSFLWSHVLWIFFRYPEFDRYEELRRYAKDLDREPMMRFFEKYDWLCVTALGVALFSTGAAIGGWVFGVSLVTWALFLRTVLVWHGTWLVNSATHLWGYQTYKTDDNSRNNWWVALISFGEGWHNNHHADQRSAAHGHRWWEIDLTYWTIRLMALVGLARDVIKPRQKRVHAQ